MFSSHSKNFFLITAFSLCAVQAVEAVAPKDYVIDEIISTEKNYNTQLKELKSRFLDAIVNDSNLKQNKYVQDTVRKILVYIDPIIATSDALLAGFNKSKTTDNLVNTFIAYAPFLRVYAPYANGYTNMLKEIHDKRFKDNSDVKKFESALSKASHYISEDILITPVQRVPRYSLLFKDLLSKDPSNTRITAAINAAGEMGKYINSYK